MNWSTIRNSKFLTHPYPSLRIKGRGWGMGFKNEREETVRQFKKMILH